MPHRPARLSRRVLFTGLLLATGTVEGLVLLATGAAAPPALAQPAPPLAPMGVPACTCASPVDTALHPLQNCTCGGLQCVIAGARPPASPALVCIR